MDKNKDKNKKETILPLLKDYSSRKEWEEISWKRILESEKLLKLMTTSRERHDLVMRAAVLEGLSLGKGQRQLSRELSISLQTINAVKKAAAENNYRSYKERSKTERKKKKYSVDFRYRKHRGRPVRTKYGIVHMPY